MTETYFPFDAGAGSAVLEDGWSKMARLWQTDGFDLVASSTSNLITAGTGLQVLQAAGNGLVKGFFYNNDASKAFTVPGNVSGNPRIDRVVLRLDRAGNIINSQYLQGTPAGSPSPPALTQVEGGVWEIPIGKFTVVNNATVPSSLVDERVQLGISAAGLSIATSENLGASAYTDLATAGPAVTVNTGTKAFVIVSANILVTNVVNIGRMSFAVSGSTVIAAADGTSLGANTLTPGGRASAISLITTLNPGANTFTAKYSSTGSTSSFANRQIAVISGFA